MDADLSSLLEEFFDTTTYAGKIGDWRELDVEDDNDEEKVDLGKLFKGEWNEEDHPRDDDGRFGSGGGDASSAWGPPFPREISVSGVGWQENLDAADALMKVEGDAWHAELGTNERNALGVYVGTGYVDINNTLRRGESHTLTPTSAGGLTKEQVGFNIERLDAALSKASLKEATVVYRALEPKLTEHLLGVNEGSEFVDKGFISTSLSSDIAHAGFGSSSTHPVIARIAVPAGYRAGYLVQRREAELLLARGSKFKITSRSPGMINGHTGTFINMEVVGVSNKYHKHSMLKGDTAGLGSGDKFVWGTKDVVFLDSKSKKVDLSKLLKEWNEEDHPRDDDGRFGTGGGGGKDSDRKGKTITNPASDMSKKAAPAALLQSGVDSLDTLYARAREAEPEFVDLLNSLAKDTGGEAAYTPKEYAEPGTTLKTRESTERKVAQEYGGDYSRISDVVRGTVMHDTVKDARHALAEFIDANSDSILEVRDRFVTPLNGGYRDLMVKMRLSNGHVAEVQFNARRMLDAKNGPGHKLYESMRSLTGKAVEAGRALNVGERVKLAAMSAASVVLYDGAYIASGNGNWT